MRISNFQFPIYGKKGFTLLEMIVAVGIFTIVLTIAMSSLLNISNVYNESIYFAAVQDNLRFALEKMAKDMRVGTTYDCGGTILIPKDCPGGSSILTFKGYSGNVVIYRLNSGNNQIEMSVDDGASYLALTSKDISVEELKFIVEGAPSGDQKQPRILIQVKASSVFKNKTIKVNLQTLVSSRNLDS